MCYFLHLWIEGINKDGSDIEGAEEEGGMVTWELEPFSCLYSQDSILGGRAEYRLDGLEAGAQQDDLRRAWPVSWNPGFWDSQGYGYTGETHRGWRQFRRHALLRSKTLSQN